MAFPSVLRPQSSVLNPPRFLLPLLILLAGASIQAHALVQEVRFFPDEALFSTFARSAALNGDWLLHGSLDKTPLSIYASALSMTFIAVRVRNGVLDFDPRLGEFAARLPGALATVVLVAVTYALALRLYQRRSVAGWAAALVAFSPYGAVYGASAYTDALMLPLAALGVLQAARGRWLWSGICLALAFAAKQQALYLLPLALALGWACDRLTVRRLAVFIAPQVAGLALLIGWDGLRAQPTSLFALAAANNPIRLIRSDELRPRLETWFAYARVLLGTPTIVFSGAALVMVGERVVHAARRRDSVISLLLLAYVLVYLLAQWLLAFPIYPRYLLPLLVPAALLAARAALWLWAFLLPRLSAGEGTLIAGTLLLTLAVGARTASESRASLSEDGLNYTGIVALADYLNAQSLGAVVYDHWLGWELGYYMGQWTDKRRVYYPTPQALVADALKLADSAPRYLAAPGGAPVVPWLDALRSAGFAVERSYASQGFVVYRLTPPPAA